MVKKKEFTGKLAEPFKMDGPTIRGGATKAFEKMLLLFEHYGIENRTDNSHWRTLALKLAMDFVPGFQRSGRGRPKRSLAESVFLLADMQRLIEDRGCSESEAARILTISPRFKRRWGNRKPGSLKNAFRQVRQDKQVAEYLRELANRGSTKNNN